MYLAEYNVARIRPDLGMMQHWRFTRAAQKIVEAAARAPGHVWSEQNTLGDLYSTRSVWESADALRRFVYSGIHHRSQVRGEVWFEPSEEPSLVLFWVNEGVRPSLAEARSRLRRLRTEGPGPGAFDFTQKALLRGPAVLA